MKSTAVLSHGRMDLSSMPKSEVSKNLFGQIQWEEIQRSGLFLEHKHHQLLERAQSNLGVVLDSPTESKEYVTMLIKIAENCGLNMTVQQYVFTRIEEILGLGLDFNDVDIDAYGIKHAKLFTTNGVQLSDAVFGRALNLSEFYVQRSASVSFACLLTVCQGSIDGLIGWIKSKLSSTTNGVWDMALPALGMLTRGQSCRSIMIAKGLVHDVVVILKRLGPNGNAQHVYELCFVLWALSLSSDASTKGSSSSNSETQAFLSCGAVQILIDMVSAAPTRKILRMSLSALRNLATGEKDLVLTEMLAGGLLKLIENITANNAIKQMADVDAEQDIKYLHDVLARNFRELSTFDRWKTEITTGNLRWGVVHTEKFWKENAKFVEADNYSLLKSLIGLLTSDDPTTVSIALYDLGEFTRFYPNGRVLVSKLGGKDIVMKMMAEDNANPDVQRQALQCISKIMVTNWEFLR